MYKMVLYGLHSIIFYLFGPYKFEMFAENLYQNNDTLYIYTYIIDILYTYVLHSNPLLVQSTAYIRFCGWHRDILHSTSLSDNSIIVTFFFCHNLEKIMILYFPTPGTLTWSSFMMAEILKFDLWFQMCIPSERILILVHLFALWKVVTVTDVYVKLININNGFGVYKIV